MRDAHGGAQLPHLVLEQFRQRFQYFPLRLEFQHAFHAIVVGLDDGGLGFGVGGAFDHVRVQGALGEHFRVSHGIPENVDEQASDDAAFLFRIAFSVQSRQEAFGGIHRFNFHVHTGEIGPHFLCLVFAEQTVIHKDGAHVHARFMQQNGQNGAVHAAGDAADHLPVAYAFPDFPDEFPFKVSDVELFKIGRTGKEVAQDGAPFMGMSHFRMKLDAEDGFSP